MYSLILKQMGAIIVFEKLCSIVTLLQFALILMIAIIILNKSCACHTSIPHECLITILISLLIIRYIKKFNFNSTN